MIKLHNMVTSKPIKCTSCKKDSGYTEEQFRHYLLQNDVNCPHCGSMLIKCNKVTF